MEETSFALFSPLYQISFLFCNTTLAQAFAQSLGCAQRLGPSHSTVPGPDYLPAQKPSIQPRRQYESRTATVYRHGLRRPTHAETARPSAPVCCEDPERARNRSA